MSQVYHFHIDPRDVLFFRDGKAMEESDAGMGANFPRPDHLYSAFIHAFHRHFPEKQPWEHAHVKTKNDNEHDSFRFGGLKIAGPFPEKNGVVYLPCPADVMPSGENKAVSLQLRKAVGTNLPTPLTHVLAATTGASKESVPSWWTIAEYEQYLKGEQVSFSGERKLYSEQRNIGIEIEGVTGSVVDGKLYQAEYLRLAEGVKLAVSAECEVYRQQETKVDVFQKIIEKDKVLSLVMGGQQGVAFCEQQVKGFSLPEKVLGEGDVLRWTLISPAVFEKCANHEGGWLPSFIKSDGTVQLKDGKMERNPGENRQDWRKRIQGLTAINAKLIGAGVKRPISFSGWSLRSSKDKNGENKVVGAKQTYLAVPAGSVYYFAGEKEELKKLAKLLQWNGGEGQVVKNRRSGSFGEKGFGLGLCSFIKSNKNN